MMNNRRLFIVLVLLYLIVIIALLIYNNETFIVGGFNSLLFFLTAIINVFYLYAVQNEFKYISIKKTFYTLISINIILFLLSKFMDFYIVHYFDPNILQKLVSEEIQVMNKELEAMGAVSSMNYEDIEKNVTNKFSFWSIVKSLFWATPFISLFTFLIVLSFSRIPKLFN